MPTGMEKCQREKRFLIRVLSYTELMNVYMGLVGWELVTFPSLKQGHWDQSASGN